MTGREINLAQMLARREARFQEQKLFQEQYNGTLISFTMNIPGPIKTNNLIRNAFDIGKTLLLEKLVSIHAVINHSSEIHEYTGDELLLSVSNIPPQTLKDLAISIETSSPAARLYDIDIIDSQGRKLTRQNFRKCLICERQAQECARSRTHTVQEMQEAVLKLLS